MLLTHLGHACFLIETGGARLLIDPGTLSDTTGVTGLDAVLVTHQHADHVDPARLRALLAASPTATLVVDPDTVGAVLVPLGSPAHTVVRPGDRLTFGATTVDVLGGLHAAVHGPVPGCTNSVLVVDGGAFVHPGDSFTVPPHPVDVLAVAVDGPWLKLGEAIDYVHAVAPRAALAMHEGETTDPAKRAGMLTALCPEGVARALPRGEATRC